MMIKTDRLSIRRVRTDDRIAIQDIWADAAKSFYAQYDKPNALDDQSVSLRISKWASFSNSDKLIGRRLSDCHNPESRDIIQQDHLIDIIMTWIQKNQEGKIDRKCY